MKKLITLSLLLSSSVWANMHLAPPDFNTKSGRAVFVDFSEAEYNITYDIENQVTMVKTRIKFNSTHAGLPVFDLIPTPRSMKVDGKKVKYISAKTPEDKGDIRLVNENIAPGSHVLEMENEIYTNVLFNDSFENVSSAFWIRDLKTRMFLEQYIPSNFEFDQYKMTFNVNFIGSEVVDQEFFTNGVVTKISNKNYKIEFPEYFTVSCPFYHTSPKGWLPREDFNYTSVDGRVFPITIYSPWKSRTKKFVTETIRVMKELENDYGPWAHPSFLAYGRWFGTGGMEHSGATATSFKALDHEMLHSYFAKGVMPASGDSGWIDEAIASWRDKGYQRNPAPGFEGSNIGRHSPYKRNTDDRSYKLGSAFMAYLDYRLQDVGGLKAFLRGYFSAYKHTVITTQHFKNNLEFFSGLDLSHEFDTLIWGTNTPESEEEVVENEYHNSLTSEQLKAML